MSLWYKVHMSGHWGRTTAPLCSQSLRVLVCARMCMCILHYMICLKWLTVEVEPKTSNYLLNFWQCCVFCCLCAQHSLWSSSNTSAQGQKLLMKLILTLKKSPQLRHVVWVAFKKIFFFASRLLECSVRVWNKALVFYVRVALKIVSTL